MVPTKFAELGPVGTTWPRPSHVAKALIDACSPAVAGRTSATASIRAAPAFFNSLGRDDVMESPRRMRRSIDIDIYAIAVDRERQSLALGVQLQNHAIRVQ